MARNRIVPPGHSQAGQAGLIVVLLSVVVLTIGLSLMVRTTQQAQITAQQEESAKVFGAAESGIEKALADIQISQDDVLQTHLDQGSAAELAINTTDPITINWSFVTCTQNPAALIISIYNNTSGTISTRFEAIKGPAAQGCTNGTNFYDSVSAGTSPYKFSYTLALQANDYLVRIEPVFNSTDIMAEGPAINRAQYTVTAKAQDVDGNTQAKAIEVRRTLSTPPSFMDYTLYSGSSITK
jgi:Tfp pilus assembly protein PilX